MKAVFDKAGMHPLGIVCLAHRFEDQRFASVTPVTILDDGSDESKNSLSKTFRHAVRACESVGVFFFTETWSLDFESPEEYEVWKDRDLSEHPRGYETLYLSLEHRAFGTHLWQARITRDATGHGTVGEFEQRDGQFEGRMAGFLDGDPEGQP
jgi:hypothetical protein